MTSEKIEQIRKKIKDAPMVLVGIGEEFTGKVTEEKKLEEYEAACSKIQEKEAEYGWMLPFLEPEEIRKHAGRRIAEAYVALSLLLSGKNYFIITTCMDGLIYEADLQKERIVAPCGGFAYLQCKKKCSEDLIPSKGIVEEIKKAVYEGKISGTKRPLCPRCGGELEFNNIKAENYNEKGYLPMWEKYTKWLQGTLNRNVCILELGVGMRYPGVIRFPFEKAAFFNQKADFIRVHGTLFQMSEELKDKGISVEEKAPDFLLKMTACLQNKSEI